MIDRGPYRSTYVQALVGDPEKWDQWPEIRRCNPLTAIDANFRRKLLEERDDARRDSRLKARFLSYRLNVPSADESTLLLSPDDWRRVVARPVPDRAGQAIVGVDLGAGRAWSAAVAAWRSGRVEAIACAPGIPDIGAQERRDRVPRGTYQSLVDVGSLRVSEGLRVQPPAELWKAVVSAWGAPEVLICDRFRLGELLDCTGGTPVVPRIYPVVGSVERHPRASEIREGWPALVCRVVPSIDGGESRGGSRGERQAREHATAQARDEQLRAR